MIAVARLDGLRKLLFIQAFQYRDKLRHYLTDSEWFKYSAIVFRAFVVGLFFHYFIPIFAIF